MGGNDYAERAPLLSASPNTFATLERHISAPRDVSPLPQADKDDEQKLSLVQGSLICLSVWILIFILTINISLITTIQSPIASDLGVSDEVSWFTSAYLIAITSIMPVAGRLCTIFSVRVYLVASVLIQVCGLFLTSQATALATFLAGRAVTGIGSAAITPIAFILVTELTSPQRRGLYFGCINTGYTAGVAGGAIIAGALEPVVGWRAVFWMQIPFALVAGAGAFLSIPPPKAAKLSTTPESLTEKLGQIDYFGVLSIIAAVVLLLYSLSSPRIHITPIILSIMAFILFIFVEANWATQPIVPVSVLKSRGNILTGLATMGLMSARWGILFYTPTYVLTLRGWPQSQAGLTLIPTNLGFAIGGLLAGWLHIRRTGSFYISCLVAFALFAGTMFAVSWISTPTSNIYLYFLILFVNGAIVGSLLNYSLAHVLHLTPTNTHIIVIPLNAMFRSLSGSFGSSISGGLFLRTLSSALRQGFEDRGIFKGKDKLIRQLVGTPILAQKLAGVDREVALFGYEKALRTIYLSGGFLAIVMLVVQAGTGWTAPEEDKDENGIGANGIHRVGSRDEAIA
jgi:MFS family permease